MRVAALVLPMKYTMGFSANKDKGKRQRGNRGKDQKTGNSEDFLWYVELKCQQDATEVFIAELIAFSTYFGHHYAHHQELKSIIRFAGCCFTSRILQTGHITLSSTPDQQLENHGTKYHRKQPPYNTLELLMMGIVVPETCWANNKICNIKPLLHLVGILFPHINYDARSKSHEIKIFSFEREESVVNQHN